MTVANAQLEVEGGDVERALSMLRGVAPGSAHYLAARTALADLYLTYRSDRRMYALCHEEVVRRTCRCTRLVRGRSRTDAEAASPLA